jgi:hypothetical protein
VYIIAQCILKLVLNVKNNYINFYRLEHFCP